MRAITFLRGRGDPRSIFTFIVFELRMKKISFLAKVITFLNLKNTAGTLITMPLKSTLKSIFFISDVLGIKTKKLMEQTFDLEVKLLNLKI